MSKAREALFKIRKARVIEKSVGGVFSDYCISSIEETFEEESNLLNELATRDEPKSVLHENTMKQFGKCPVCNSSVAIQFHSDFCGKCGNRLKWRGETI